MTPFKTWLMYQINTWGVNNFPFLENQFDALTDYELFCKMMEYIINYQKEFDRIEKEIKDFEAYISTLNIEQTVNEILERELPALERSILYRSTYSRPLYLRFCR